MTHAAADADTGEADIDPTGHLLAMVLGAIHAREHGGDPDAAHKVAALGDEGEEQPDTDVWDDDAPVVSKAVADARLPYHGSYPGDACPECGEKPAGACRCLLNDRFCANGHSWRREKGTGMPLLVEGGHGPVIKTYGSDSQ